MMRLALAIQTPEVPKLIPVALLQGNLEEKLIKASRLGYEGVELITTDPAQVDVQAVRQSLQSNGLCVSAIASGGMAFALGLTLLHSEADIASLAQKRLLAMVDLAAALQAPVVTIGSFRGRGGDDKQAALERLANVLYHAAQHAGNLGIRLALEPLNRYEADLIHTVSEGLQFLAMINHPAVGLLVDSYHVNIEESAWDAPYLEALQAQRLYYVHVGDNNRKPPGEGLIDFSIILKALDKGGYDGWISAELFPYPDADRAAELTIAHLRQSWDKKPCN